MEKHRLRFDWNHARAFLVSAESGSFSAAARALGLTQSTLSRQVAGLEKAVGTTLFERAGRSLRLTDAGQDLLEHCREMDLAAMRAATRAAGRSREVAGVVSISATDSFCAYALPAALRRVADLAPGIQVELVVSDRAVDLARREADIAIRHARPDDGQLVARLLREEEAHLHASSAYLDRFGRPRSLEAMRDATFVGLAPLDRLRDGLARIGLPLARERFGVVADSGVVMCELIRQGFGIGVLSSETARRLQVERLTVPLPPVAFQTWLVSRRELYTSARIRRVFDILAQTLRHVPDAHV